ncbi:hypothetical protein NDU88_010090 [Pleurodeles waltl]|uniref:Secreted protein n=1 Tax=Pleurodeles waltl TaxID=8319 RepID=A0AAV7RY66_PLEWA|nr:hypothetical protein NDU88_010090 [Pleurodeles waltl]
MSTQHLLVLALPLPPHSWACTTALHDRRSSREALSQQVNPKVQLRSSEPPGSTSGPRDFCEMRRLISASRNLRYAPAPESQSSARCSNAAARHVLPLQVQ